MTDIRDQLIFELDSARERMTRLVAGLDPALEVYPGWTEKQLLAHITGWDDLVINTLNRHLLGQPIVVSISRGIDYYNETTVNERQDLPLEHVRREYLETRETLKRLIRSVPAEMFDDIIVMPWGPRDSLVNFIRTFSHHELEHEEEIRQNLEKQAGQP